MKNIKYYAKIWKMLPSNRYLINKIPFVSIKGTSNNEILNEGYDYSVMNNLIKGVEKIIVSISKVIKVEKRMKKNNM